MKKNVIIGNSAAGITMAETIRQFDKDSAVTIVSAEPFLSYDRCRVLNFIAGKVREKELFLKSEDFYEANGIELLLEREVVDVNFDRKRVFFKTKGFLDFDNLMIASGCGVQLPVLKGIQKQGVVALNGLNDVKFISENLPIAHTVVIVGDDTLAQELAVIIVQRGIEVKLMGKLDASMDGVDVISDNAITEVLGDGDVRAVRLCSNKVIGASLVIFTSPRRPNVDFLKETPIRINKGILVDEAMRTNIPFVFAAGGAAEFLNRNRVPGWNNSVEEAVVAARVLCEAQQP